MNCVSKLTVQLVICTSVNSSTISFLHFSVLSKSILKLIWNVLNSKSSHDDNFFPHIAYLLCDWLNSTEKQERGGK